MEVALKGIITLLFGVISWSSLAQDRTVGIIQNSQEAFHGYTLFSPHGNTSVYLINNCGEKVHEWVSAYNPGNAVYLMEDGSLYRAGKSSGLSFNAGGVGGVIEKFDWEGNVLWTYEYSTTAYRHHHDFQVLPNGNVLLLAWELKTEEEAIVAGRNPELIVEGELWPEHLVEVQPVGENGGEIVWEWHAWDHLVQDFDAEKENYGSVSENFRKIDLNYLGEEGGADWHHANAVTYHDELDQIIINVLEFDEFWIIDHNTTTEEAKGPAGDLLYRWGNPMAYGMGIADDKKLFAQHNSHWIPAGLPDAGKILIFNNGPGRPEGDYSSVVKVTPEMNEDGTYKIHESGRFMPLDYDWEYVDQTPTNFYSRFISGAQQLPNGNVLVDDGAHGTFFEINEDDEIVWKYVNPVAFRGTLAQGDPIMAEEATRPDNIVFRATKYAHDYPAFIGKDLTSLGPIEQNPTDFACELITAVKVADVTFQVFPNPASDYLIIELAGGVASRVEMMSLSGHSVFKAEQVKQIDVSGIENGFYLLKVDHQRPKKVLIRH